MKLYAVGGAVRDHLRGTVGKDLDFAVEAESFVAMVEGLTARGLEVFLLRPEYVTVRGRIPIRSLPSFGGLIPPVEVNPLGKSLDIKVAADFTLCRKEAMYSDKRHPDTVTPADILTDLSRRDFTINAIAISEDGEIIDPHGGQDDIRKRAIRTVGSAHQRFEEDPLRMLRAIRFAVTLGFHPTMSVDHALKDQVLYLTSLPVERIHEELNLALRVNWHETMWYLMVNYPIVGHVLATIVPELWLKATTEDR